MLQPYVTVQPKLDRTLISKIFLNCTLHAIGAKSNDLPTTNRNQSLQKLAAVRLLLQNGEIERGATAWNAEEEPVNRRLSIFSPPVFTPGRPRAFVTWELVHARDRHVTMLPIGPLEGLDHVRTMWPPKTAPLTLPVSKFPLLPKQYETLDNIGRRTSTSFVVLLSYHATSRWVDTCIHMYIRYIYGREHWARRCELFTIASSAWASL